MGTTAQKLQKVLDSKEAIKQSIINKGVSVGDVMSEYASAIDGIETGITPSGTLEITENGEKDVANYAKVNVNVPQNKPTLNTPTISLNDNTLTITNPSSNGSFVESYDVYNNGSLLTNTTSKTLDLSTLLTESGTYSISVKAKGTNFNDSANSNNVEYIISSGYNVEITILYQGAKIYEGTDNSGNLLVDHPGYEESITVKTSSEYLYIDADAYAYHSPDPVTTGGVSVVSKTDITVTVKVTGDGSITVAFMCLVEDTPITLANHKYKPVQDITYEDDLLVWDFDKGEFASAKPLWIMKERKSLKYNHLVFSDGSELNTVNQHRIFNVEKGMFTYPMTDDTPIGTTTFNDKGEYVTLVSKEVIEKEVNYYNIITDYHINLFAGTILTSCRLSNLYPIEDMKYVKDNRDIIDYEEFNNIPIEYYYGLRLGEQPVDINRDGAVSFGDTTVEDYVKRLISMKKE